MIVVNRFRVPEQQAADFRADLQGAREVLAASAGCQGSDLGRNVDDPTLWLLHTQWRDVGSYRRALSSSAAKMMLTPLFSFALDEPGAYERVEPGAELNESVSRSLP